MDTKEQIKEQIKARKVERDGWAYLIALAYSEGRTPSPHTVQRFRTDHERVEQLRAKLDALDANVAYMVPIDPAEATQCDSCQ